MFYKTRYVIEPKLAATFAVPFARDTYSVKDRNGNLLGYFKKKKRIFGGGEFWIEGTDGTRQGEIHTSRNRYDIYDVQNQLRGTIRKAPSKKEESRRFLLALILAFVPMLVFVAFIILSLATSGGALASNLPTEVLLIFVFSCGGLTMFGLFLFAYLAHKGRFGKPKWFIEDSEGRQLAEGNDFSLSRHLKILTPDGSIIARVRTKRGLPLSRHINITRQGFEPLLIVSYTVLMAWRAKEATYAMGGV